MKRVIMEVKKIVISSETEELIEAISELCKKHDVELIQGEYPEYYSVVSEIDD